MPTLMALTAEQSVVEGRATRVPMAGPVVEVPALDVTLVPTSGETAFFGGVQANWEEEASTTAEEEPTFKQIRLQARELKGYTLASNSLLADNAIGLEALLMQLFAGAIAWHKDRAFLRGTGANQPLGVLNANCLISVTRSAASAVALADLAGMMGRFLPGWSPQNTVWACHPTVQVKLMQITSSSTGGTNLFVGARLQDRLQWELFGIPVIVTEKLPALNTLGDILLLNLKHYLVGERQQVEIAFSEHVAFRTNQGAWRFVCRVDGQPWLRSAVTLSDASNTLSPFVGLAAG
jgi:HK97 family phage major capsid protein